MIMNKYEIEMMLRPFFVFLINLLNFWCLFKSFSNFFLVERLFSILYYLPRRGFRTEGSDARKHWLLYSPLFLVWANFCALLSEIQNAAMDSLCEYALAKANDTCVKLNGLFRLKSRNKKDLRDLFKSM